MRKRPRRKADWGQLGPAMKNLPNDRWRAFVYAYLTQKPGHGALSRAARAAGFGKNSRNEIVARIAWKLSRDERMIAAIAEEARKIVRVAHPEAANALVRLLRSPDHKDHGRAIAMVLDRGDPVETRSRHEVDVVHRVIDPDREALEELRALRALNTPREKLLELFGPNGLDRIERLDSADAIDRADSRQADRCRGRPCRMTRQIQPTS